MGNIWLDLGAKTASVEVVIENPVTSAANLGNLGRASIADIDLSGATITSDPTGRTVTVTERLRDAAGGHRGDAEPGLHRRARKSESVVRRPGKFAAGDPLGTFSFTVQTQ